MLISKNRFKKIWYYLKKGRINVFLNVFRLSLLNILNDKYKSRIKKIDKKFLIFSAPNNSNFSGEISVSIIVPVYNQWDYTYLCLKSILKNTEGISYEVIIADDNSSDETVNIEKYVKNVKIIRNKNNLGFLRNCNNAAKHASGKYILFLNNDTEVQKDWLKNL